MNNSMSVSFVVIASALLMFLPTRVAVSEVNNIYNPGNISPIASQIKVRVGDQAVDFALPSVDRGEVRLSDYTNKKNVVLSFVPAAFTPVCSAQWPGYNIAESLFQKYDAELFGITTDNIPTLYAWTKEMGDLWFPVLSDYWPHGAVSDQYGILRSDGVAERALIVIDKAGIIRYIDVHDINKMPALDDLMEVLKKL